MSPLRPFDLQHRPERIEPLRVSCGSWSCISIVVSFVSLASGRL